MSNAMTALQIDRLEAWYGESQVLFGASLDVREGETVTLLGRNGAGKTTTLRSIVGLVRRRKGSITIGQSDLIALPIHKIAKTGIGYVPEERGIFASLTVEENLRLPPKIAEGGLSVAEIFRMFPNLEERRNSPGTKLSGGEPQMLAIARVLRTGARLLLLDEPTEGLAPVIVQRIGELLCDLKSRGYTILLVEQNFRFAAKLADRFFVMENGRVIDALTSADIKRRSSALHQYLGV
ncbi:MAG: Broad-specificity amino acid ABC transporter, ATP-binding protein 2 [uncultured Paraburkholderia sp.]|uniref:ABC transporter ATP-binding protein n=1 Tax=uncultured Paraburkholderia sp. TaxID=1822466 RepID=UPI00259224ED|nr:ABC transporter ATP-binding protein [uncultured Paraburkholderia sp.]CAH2904008.1 MAG: Broad-specificity amino acid ABC transporter, ATP-binding protein 2 [uncultured Paraburkholderia sp.]CAH2942183.1 MAG: Broad-specificity amino acid ABC transporter, ATP-binding protein 2 [uncultured Paraburkholderia sp.]